MQKLKVCKLGGRAVIGRKLEGGCYRINTRAAGVQHSDEAIQIEVWKRFANFNVFNDSN